jgi:hypothetical protein
MKKITGAGFSAALVLALASQAWAQRGDEFGRGYSSRVDWYPSLERAMSGQDSGDRSNFFFGRRMDPVEKKYIFVYVRPLTEDKEPNEFVNQDVVTASREKWAFLKMDFDKENPQLKAWGVGRAPAIVGCDLHANDFQKMPSAGLDAIRSVLKNVPPAVVAYEAKLKADYSKALEQIRTDEEKGVKILVEIVARGKHGYKEVAEAQKRLDEITQASVQKGELAEAVSVEAGIDYNEDLAKTFKTSSAGVMAEIRVARLEHERGNAAVAIARLLKVQKYDARTLKKEIEEAGKALEEISKAGEAKIDAALALDRAAAREVLRKLAKDYTGTEAGKKATEAAKRME